jgi:ribosomal protein S18 acetylase RimI-like enzyme
MGYREAVTGALAPVEQVGFLAAGFEIREHLHLLTHDLAVLPDLPAPPLRRARRGDWDGVLAVDALAFDEFWRLDEAGLSEALSATPTVRFRVAPVEQRIVGYAVAGKAGRRGYLQRLAVDPDHQGCGLGLALTVDSLRWMRRRNAEVALVNTQLVNQRAYDLYVSLGFRPEPDGLGVLRRSVETPAETTQ